MTDCCRSGTSSPFVSVNLRKLCMTSLSTISLFRRADTRCRCHGGTSMNPSQTTTSSVTTGFRNCCTDWSRLLPSCKSMMISYKINWRRVSLSLLWRQLCPWADSIIWHTMLSSALIRLPPSCVLSMMLQQGQTERLCTHWSQRILHILTRFRSLWVALTADIEKAFLMISVAESDRDVLQFLWVDDLTKDPPDVRTFRFTRVMFGVSSSPFLLNTTIKYHLE